MSLKQSIRDNFPFWWCDQLASVLFSWDLSCRAKQLPIPIFHLVMQAVLPQAELLSLQSKSSLILALEIKELYIARPFKLFFRQFIRRFSYLFRSIRDCCPIATDSSKELGVFSWCWCLTLCVPMQRFGSRKKMRKLMHSRFRRWYIVVFLCVGLSEFLFWEHNNVSITAHCLRPEIFFFL